MLKQISALFTFLLLTQFCTAQTWQWARRGGGSAGLNNQAEKIVDMQCDKNGNVYLLAQLDGGTDVVFGTATGDTIPPTLPGGRDAALISYDCNGMFRWAKVLGGNIDDDAIGMGLDTLGHINVCVLSPSVIFKVDSDTSVTSNNRKLIKLIQYDTAGHYKWIKQPTPDTVKVANTNKYGAFNMTVMPNGDSYLFCILGTGLISGTTNLVVSTAGYYMLKYNVAGVPKELVKLDMRGTGSPWNYVNFSVTKSRKFLFTALRNTSSSPTDSLIIGGQKLNHPLFLCCFSQTGNVLWRVENTDTVRGVILGKPLVDESKGFIYVSGGGIDGYGSIVDTLGGVPMINQGTTGTLPYFFCIDTLGSFKQIKWGSCYAYIGGNGLNGLTFRSDGRLFAYGTGAGVLWGGFKFDGVNGQGYQTFLPSFDANTGAIMSMDSLRGNGTLNADVIAADNNNNIYVGGQLSSNIKVGTQTLTSTGGQSDFFVAKYGYANCSGVVPLKFTNYALRQTRGDKVENLWTTANEINVSHFNIQRSINGRDFTTIGKVVASNKSYNEYSFMDNGQQSTADGRLYYRIESIDFDGRKQYSEIRNVELGIRNGGLSVYPNPAKDFVTIECAGANKLLVIDNLGRTIKQFNNLTQPQILNCKQLSNGVYIVKAIMINGDIKTEKLIVK